MTYSILYKHISNEQSLTPIYLIPAQYISIEAEEGAPNYRLRQIIAEQLFKRSGLMVSAGNIALDSVEKESY